MAGGALKNRSEFCRYWKVTPSVCPNRRAHVVARIRAQTVPQLEHHVAVDAFPPHRCGCAVRDRGTSPSRRRGGPRQTPRRWKPARRPRRTRSRRCGCRRRRCRTRARCRVSDPSPRRRRRGRRRRAGIERSRSRAIRSDAVRRRVGPLDCAHDPVDRWDGRRCGSAVKLPPSCADDRARQAKQRPPMPRTDNQTPQRCIHRNYSPVCASPYFRRAQTSSVFYKFQGLFYAFQRVQIRTHTEN